MTLSGPLADTQDAMKEIKRQCLESEKQCLVLMSNRWLLEQRRVASRGCYHCSRVTILKSSGMTLLILSFVFVSSIFREIKEQRVYVQHLPHVLFLVISDSWLFELFREDA